MSVNHGASVAPIYGSDLSEFLRAVFEDHHQRSPTGAEINHYSTLSRNAGPLESYVAMVGSDDYFISQCQRDSQVYIRRLYQLFLHRDPQPDELRFWVNQYQSSRVDRVSFVQQFCQANNISSVPGSPMPYRPASKPSSNVVYSADALLTKVRLLTRIATGEFGGTWFGRNLLSATASLQAATSQFRDTVSSGDSTRQQIKIAADNLERALQQVESQFRAVPSASDQCRNLLWEISELVTALQTANVSVPIRPTPVSPLQQNVNGLMVSLKEFASSLSAFQHLSPAYANLNRDLNGLYVQAQGLAAMLQTTPRQSDLSRVVTSMNMQGRDIGRQLLQSDSRLRQGWWDVQHQLEQVTVSAGTGGDFYVTSGHPVIINRPSWDRLPGQVSPGHYPSAQNRQVVSDADRLLSLLDNYVGSLRPLVSRNRDVATMTNQVLDLRHEVLVLRQKAASGAFGSQLRYASRDVLRQYRDVASKTFARMVANDSTLNSPSWMQIGQIAYQIDKRVLGG
ncbi:hypothetical protein Poly41_67510 [Novipirellula artificiosorum]|uniref:DUF4214 domain-containing protein n=2 Tax=Novipirellula artificiosorum TaxID=2528016 RepID=A0A5C6CWW7_9BACT|nr:hypothetical protein Poly41_67510 [Novipirellula artificiosorum]